MTEGSDPCQLQRDAFEQAVNELNAAILLMEQRAEALAACIEENQPPMAMAQSDVDDDTVDMHPQGVSIKWVRSSLATVRDVIRDVSSKLKRTMQ